MSTRVLVLGADGFIGSHVVAALAAADWASPVAAGRRTRAAAAPAAPERLQLDARDESALAAALRGADAVVNCLAGDAAMLMATTRALLAAASRQERHPLIVHLSSMAVYGGVTGPVPESTPMAGADPYALAKIATEQAVRAYDSFVVLRPGIVYGPGGTQWSLRIARWLRQRRIGDLGAAGDGYCNLVFAGDVAQAALQAIRLEPARSGTFNLGLPAPPTWNEYLVRYARALGAVPIARIGRRRLSMETKLLAPPLKILEIVARKAKLTGLRLPEAIPPSFLRLCRQEIRLEVTQAEALLRMQWMPLETGLQRTAAWVTQSAI